MLPGSWLISPQKYCPEILGLNCNNDENDGRIIQKILHKQQKHDLDNVGKKESHILGV